MAVTPHICVIGSLNIDFVTSTPRFPQAGETLTATSFSVYPGGKGANQAVACGRASFIRKSQRSATVSMIGAVGAGDLYYESLLKATLEDSGVNTIGVEESKDGQTGSATIIVDEAAAGENRILVVPGANYTGMKDVGKIITTIDNFQQPVDVVVMQGEIPRPTVLTLLHHFNHSDRHTQVVFNPAPMFPEGLPLSALENLAVLIVNETEAMQLASTIAKLTADIRNGTEVRPQQLASHLHIVAGVRIVLVTLGSKGVFFSTKTGRQGYVSGVKVENVVDTTAAGDTFVGFFAAKFAEFVATASDITSFDAYIERAVEKANATAAICVGRSGAMPSIPFAYELI